jgi:ankyrin repeat protein
MASRRARDAAPRDTTASCLAQVRAFLSDARTPKTAETLLFSLCGAVSQDYAGDAVRMLLLSGAPVNGRENGKTPLIWAAVGGNAVAARMLLDAGADPLALTSDTGECPLSLAIAYSGALGPTCHPRADYLGVFAALARKRDTKNAIARGRPQSAVFAAAHGGADALLKALLESGGDPNSLVGSRARRSALFDAV